MILKTDYPFNSLINILDVIIKAIKPESLKKLRWFKSKNEVISSHKIIDYGIADYIPDEKYVIPLVISISFKEQENNNPGEQLYYIPLIISTEKKDEEPWLEIQHPDYTAFVYDGIHSKEYIQTLNKLDKVKMAAGGQFTSRDFRIEQITCSSPLTDVSSNSLTLVSNNRVIKTYRNLIPGVNPELELTISLSRETNFNKFPKTLGYITYIDRNDIEYNVCLLEEYLDNNGNVWDYTKAFLTDYFKSVEKNSLDNTITVKQEAGMDAYCTRLRRLGEVIASLHLSLARVKKPNFRPENPSDSAIEQWYQNTEKNLIEIIQMINTSTLSYSNPDKNTSTSKIKKHNFGKYSEELNQILRHKDVIFADIKKIFHLKPYLGKYMRIHGDLHLEQILMTENDFIILDFEGEPLKPISNRRKKNSPLKDLAGIVRSINYASYGCLFEYLKKENIKESENLLTALSSWEKEVVRNFLEGYKSYVRKKGGNFLPPPAKFDEVLSLFKLEKALYEFIYEINNRPDWLLIPIRGILDCIK